MDAKQTAAKARIDARRAEHQRLLDEHTKADRAYMDTVEAAQDAQRIADRNWVGIGTN